MNECSVLVFFGSYLLRFDARLFLSLLKGLLRIKFAFIVWLR